MSNAVLLAFRMIMSNRATYPQVGSSLPRRMLRRLAEAVTESYPLSSRPKPPATAMITTKRNR